MSTTAYVFMEKYENRYMDTPSYLEQCNFSPGPAEAGYILPLQTV